MNDALHSIASACASRVSGPHGRRDRQEFRALEPLLLHLTGARYADLNWVWRGRARYSSFFLANGRA